jgi:hypothetical protein
VLKKPVSTEALQNPRRLPSRLRACLPLAWPLLLLAACSKSSGSSGSAATPGSSAADPAALHAEKPSVAEASASLEDPPIAYVGETSEEVVETTYEDGNPNVRRQVKRDAQGIRNHGLYQHWSPSGQLLVEAQYADGLPHGKQAEWYENGKPKSEGTCSRGLREGRWTFWLETGETDPQSGMYEKGRRVSN